MEGQMQTNRSNPSQTKKKLIHYNINENFLVPTFFQIPFSKLRRLSRRKKWDAEH